MEREIAKQYFLIYKNVIRIYCSEFLKIPLCKSPKIIICLNITYQTQKTTVGLLQSMVERIVIFYTICYINRVLKEISTELFLLKLQWLILILNYNSIIILWLVDSNAFGVWYTALNVHVTSIVLNMSFVAHSNYILIKILFTSK